MKVLHLPTSVGGNSFALSRGEKNLNIESDVLVLHDSWLRYQSDRIVFKELPQTKIQKILEIPKIIQTIMDVRDKYDIFHFNFGTSLLDLWLQGLPLLDIPFFKRKGKIVVTYNGDDARLNNPITYKEDFGKHHNLNFYKEHTMSGKYDNAKKKRTEKFGRFADAIFALNPDLFYFLPEKTVFLPYAILNNCNKVESNKHNGKKIKIVHSPTNRQVKGTQIVIDAVNEVNSKTGNRLELILVENMQHGEALEIYKQADLAIDQLNIGWYGGFAIEMMQLGIPVMAFINDYDLRFIPKDMKKECKEAFININPLTLANKLIEVIENIHILDRYAKASYDYANKWHNINYVASITKQTYEEILG
ncbi:MAG: hypothetical protein Q8920_02760 [Bacillota bacterium]|nr:hypothetical protein [Bacillota bacterium]